MKCFGLTHKAIVALQNPKLSLDIGGLMPARPGLTLSCFNLACKRYGLDPSISPNNYG